MSKDASSQIESALALQTTGKLKEAKEIYRAILELDPSCAEALHLLGVCCHQEGKNDEAVGFLESALKIDPANTGFLYNFGVILQEIGQSERAEECYRKVNSNDPGNVSAWINLGNILSDRGQFGEARDCHANVIRLQPDRPEHHFRLGNSYRKLGEIDAALSHFGIAREASPENQKYASALLFASQYEPGITRRELFRRHRMWAEKIETSAAESSSLKKDCRSPLRLGFLSPDLGNHPVGIFMAPLLDRLKDNPEFETWCFNDRSKVDEFIQRNREASNHWTEVAGLSEDQLFEFLRDSDLDILIDLTGHTENNRLALFARKPAPIAMTWAGYVGTTGLNSMDYLIADAYHCPEGCEKDFSESVLRLPNGYICYEPPAYAPDVNRLPLESAGFATFGCLNNPSKMTTPTVRLWSKVLGAIPDSRLILKYKGMDDSAVVQRVKGLFSAFGVSPDRIEMLGQTQHGEHLATFHRIDVALDPVPYSGGLSTCEAIWMGVPVVTLPGDTFASRHSLSHLTNAGLGDTVATSEEEFVEIAVRLVSDPGALSEKRETMRKVMSTSPLCDLDQFASDFTDQLTRV